MSNSSSPVYILTLCFQAKTHTGKVIKGEKGRLYEFSEYGSLEEARAAYDHMKKEYAESLHPDALNMISIKVESL